MNAVATIATCINDGEEVDMVWPPYVDILLRSTFDSHASPIEIALRASAYVVSTQFQVGTMKFKMSELELGKCPTELWELPARQAFHRISS